jgi:hypothetical protein
VGEDVVVTRFRAWPISAVALVALATAPAAFGHGPFGPARGYVSSVTSIEPNVLGLQASVVGDRLLVRNWSTRTVTILGPDGRPSLRFGRRGVFAPSGLGWKRISAGTSYGWHDPASAGRDGRRRRRSAVTPSRRTSCVRGACAAPPAAGRS